MRLSLCTNEQRGELLWALYEYSNEGKRPSTDDAVVYAMFDVMSKAVDRARASYENRSAAGRENNAKRSDRSSNDLPNTNEHSTNGLPNDHQRVTNAPKNALVTCDTADDGTQDDYQQSTNELPNTYQQTVTSNSYLGTTNMEQETQRTVPGGKPPARNAFVPPTVDEIAEHCRQRGNNIDAETFHAYYAASGWVLNGGKKMKDWKSSIITWEKRDKSLGNAASKKPTSQPMYSPMMTRVEELLNDD